MSNIEIEKKFLLTTKCGRSPYDALRPVLWRPEYDQTSLRIRQSYLWTCGTSEMRVRQIRTSNKIPKYFLAVKTKHADLDGRYEMEEEISRGFSIGLRQDCIIKEVRKTRYLFKVPKCYADDPWIKRAWATWIAKPQVWELDVYEGHNTGMVTIEVETDKVNEELFFPSELVSLDLNWELLEGERLKLLSNRNIAKWIK